MSNRVAESQGTPAFPPYTAVALAQHAPARRPWPWIIGILAGVVVVPLALCVIASAVIGSAALLWATHQEAAETTASQTYAVSGTPQITVHDPAGNIHILAGTANQVTV